MTIEDQLKELDLNKSEIRVYLHLLEEGLSTPPQIAKGTHIARTNCYNLLEALKEKGLIEEQEKGKRKAYIASDPEAFLRTIEKKKQAIIRLLPDLRALYTIQKNKPKIRFYEGWDQVKEIYFQTLAANEVFAIGSTKHLKRIDASFFNSYCHFLKEKNIVLHDILNYESGENALHDAKNILKGLYDVTTLSQNQNFQTDILIWNNNIGLITLEQPIFGTVLTSPLLADTFRTIYTVMRRATE